MPQTPGTVAAILLGSPSGLAAEINANGSLRRFSCGGVCINLFVGNEAEGGPTNLFMRRHAQTVESIALLGPGSRTHFYKPAEDTLAGVGTWNGIEYEVALLLARDAPAWFWHVRLRNTSGATQRLDLTYAHDVGLAPYGAARLNEYYVSQYVDHTPLTHDPRGFMIASRQNQAVDGRIPWSLIGSLRTGTSFATDALQFHGLATRAGAMPVGLSSDLPGRRLQHEHSLVVIRDTPILLAAGATAAAGFFGAFLADHPEATSPEDLRVANRTLALPEAHPPKLAMPQLEPAPTAQAPDALQPLASGDPAARRSGHRSTMAPAATLFSSSAVLQALDLDERELRELFGPQRTHEERDDEGGRLSFFHANCHVVLRAKELRVQRPHGHLLRTGRHLTPDETALTSTAWMSGVFHSMLTQGHVSINRLLSTVHSYLGLFRSHGQRVFVDIGGSWHLLDTPSAFEMSPQECRWFYRHAGGLLEIRSAARSEAHELSLSIEVTSGAPARFLISHHMAINGDDGNVPGPAQWSRQHETIIVRPAAGSEIARRFPQGSFRIDPAAGTHFAQVAGDELLFVDGRSRQQPFVCIVTGAARKVGMTIRGDLVSDAAPPAVSAARDEPLLPVLAIASAPENRYGKQVAQIAAIAPWFAQNAFVHYLSPRGLEQYSGGGWGTRDVCQGPVELLLATGRVAPIRDLLLTVMRAQNPDGDWPQWFMFFERERDIRPGDSHGDIVFWPVLVLGQYLLASGDAGLLEERVPFFDARGPQAGEDASLWQHTQRALELMQKRVIPGTCLAAYGHGDWNDSLQPVDPDMREHMCSAWTVTLHYQTLTTLARALGSCGRPTEAQRLDSWAASILRDFQRLLHIDGVLAGYAVFERGGGTRYLLHPRDRSSGVNYSSLAMIHAILEDMLPPEQAREQLRLIEAHLSAPDGVRLFDRPMPYHGGPQRFFQRAESATFFGREIGLMYMHAHLRYAQALAHLGEAERFFHALCQANPIGIRALVPGATIRQANCYYSSSDAAFADRYEASSEYGRIAGNAIALDGGWRVYSSGAGIALSLIMRRFLGLDCGMRLVRLDPVIPPALDGLRVQTRLLGNEVGIEYRIGAAGCGVTGVALNDHSLAFTTEPNPHRRGAAVLDCASVLAAMRPGMNTLRIHLG